MYQKGQPVMSNQRAARRSDPSDGMNGNCGIGTFKSYAVFEASGISGDAGLDMTGGQRRADRRRSTLTVFAALFTFVLVLLPCNAARGAVIKLTNSSPCAGHHCCDLTRAILSHNDKKSYGGCAAGTGNDTIEAQLPHYLVYSSCLVGCEMPAVSGGHLTISAPPYDNSTFHGEYLTVNSDAILELERVSLRIDDKAFQTNKSIITNNGGTVILRHSDLTNNGIKPPVIGGIIVNHGGKVIIRGGFGRIVALHDSAARRGGAIYNDGGTVTFDEDSQTFCERNSALDGGCIFTRNGQVLIRGRGIDGTTEQVRLLNNGGQKGGRGGAIAAENSEITIADVHIEGNNAPDNAGSAGAGGAIYLDSESSLDLSAGLYLSRTVCRNNTSGLGGCIYSDGAAVRLDHVTCGGNSAIDGGCIRTGPAGAGTLTILNSKITHNKATGDSRGGGLLVENTEVFISNSEITGNSAGAYGDGGSGSGGGIFGLTTNHASPTEIVIIGSTLAGNTASRLGAGMELENFSSLLALNTTFADEGPADVPAHGLHFDNSYANFDFTTLSSAPLSVDGVVEGDLRNSLLDKLSGYCLGNVADDGHNLQFPAPARICDNKIPVTVLGLDPTGLRDNGGRTRTIALLSQSPAIDAIPQASCVYPLGIPNPCPSATMTTVPDQLTCDQRGYPRPGTGDETGDCDAGAYEYQGRTVRGGGDENGLGEH
jgi:hypothetical protein